MSRSWYIFHDSLEWNECAIAKLNDFTKGEHNGLWSSWSASLNWAENLSSNF